MECDIRRMEVFLRVAAVLVLVLTACLVGFDSETENIFYVEKKATFKNLNALPIMVYVDSIAAGYNLLQLCQNYSEFWSKRVKRKYIYLSWSCLFLDQIAVYVVFAANLAGIQASTLAVTGETSFLWMKLCDKYTKFCYQIGGSLLCGLVASILMAVISSISAFNLFRLYSPKHFLELKPSS